MEHLDEKVGVLLQHAKLGLYLSETTVHLKLFSETCKRATIPRDKVAKTKKACTKGGRSEKKIIKRTHSGKASWRASTNCSRLSRALISVPFEIINIPWQKKPARSSYMPNSFFACLQYAVCRASVFFRGDSHNSNIKRGFKAPK